MLPETRFLLQLIERFQPERLAAIHAHSRMSLCHPCKDTKERACGGEGPGIFVDPRGIDPVIYRFETCCAQLYPQILGMRLQRESPALADSF
jgi:hypothetical protein